MCECEDKRKKNPTMMKISFALTNSFRVWENCIPNTRRMKGTL